MIFHGSFFQKHVALLPKELCYGNPYSFYKRSSKKTIMETVSVSFEHSVVDLAILVHFWDSSWTILEVILDPFGPFLAYFDPFSGNLGPFLSIMPSVLLFSKLFSWSCV